jgi:mono/diheme cytochrome c family protein
MDRFELRLDNGTLVADTTKLIAGPDRGTQDFLTPPLGPPCTRSWPCPATPPSRPRSSRHGCQEPTLRAHAARQQQVTYARLGQQLFANNCASCHGRAATGGSAPTLNSKQFLTSTSDEQIRLLISGGVSGTSMPAWSLDDGGPLTDEQIRQLVTYLRSLASGAPNVPNWRQGKP